MRIYTKRNIYLCMYEFSDTGDECIANFNESNKELTIFDEWVANMDYVHRMIGFLRGKNWTDDIIVMYKHTCIYQDLGRITHQEDLKMDLSVGFRIEGIEILELPYELSEDLQESVYKLLGSKPKILRGESRVVSANVVLPLVQIWTRDGVSEFCYTTSSGIIIRASDDQKFIYGDIDNMGGSFCNRIYKGEKYSLYDDVNKKTTVIGSGYAPYEIQYIEQYCRYMIEILEYTRDPGNPIYDYLYELR